MSKTVDERVVEMRFDNDDFEQNVKTSMSTLSKLKESLNLDGATKGLENVSEAARNVDFSPISTALESVNVKFSALEVVAITALTKITNSAIDAGIQLVKSLSIDQISAGWEKYADKTTAVQTIMSATANTWEENAEAIEFTGTQMEFVTEQLEKLNWFSDETSYSFTDMTSNIGKFTSNGVALTDAVQAMEGISTWAAKSGQSTNEASRAMYNLAQAMSVGQVSLVDWKSIENANMATTEFKQTAIDTAEQLGTLKKVSDGVWETLAGTTVTVTDFNSALTSDGWFTSDVLMATLNEYGAAAVRLSEICDEYGLSASQFLSGMDDYQKGTKTIGDILSDMGSDELTVKKLSALFDELSGEEYELGLASFKAAQEAKTFSEAIDATKDAVSTGWMTTFDTIFGNYEEAKVLWTDLANALWDVFAASGEVRNGILAVWKDEDGRDDLIEAFWNLWEAVSAVVTPVKEAFNEIFHGVTDTTADEYIESAGKKLAELTKKLKEFTASLKLNDETSDKLKRTFKGLFAALDIVKQAVGALFSGLSPLANLLPGIGGGILDITASFGDWIVALDEYLKENDVFKKGIRSVVDFLGQIPTKINEIFEALTGVSISDAFSGGLDSLKELGSVILEALSGFKNIDTSGMGSFIDSIKEKVSSLDWVGEWLTNTTKSLISFLQTNTPTLSECIDGFGNLLKGLVDTLVNIFNSVEFNKIIDMIESGILVSIGVGIAKFTKGLDKSAEAVAGTITAFKKIFKNLNGVLEGVRYCLKAYQNNLKSKTLINVAIAIGILAASLVALSLIDTDKLAAALMSITVLFVELMVAMNVLQSTSFTYDGAKITGLISFAVSIAILAGALKLIATEDWDGIARGLTGLSGIMGVMTLCVIALKTVSAETENARMSGLISFAVSIAILAGVLKLIATEDWDGIARGWTGLAGIMGTMTLCILALKTASAETNGAKITGLISFALSMAILAGAFKLIATEDWDGIARGLTGFITIAGTMTACILALQTASTKMKDLKMETVVKGMIPFAIAMLALTASFKLIANEDWDGIARGLTGFVTIAGTMTACILALEVIEKQIKSNGAASLSALIPFAVSMGILTIAFKMIANEDWDGIAKGLVGLSSVAGIMVGVIAALNIIGSKSTLVSMTEMSASLLIISASLFILIPLLKSLSSLSLLQLASGLIGLVVAVTALGACMVILGAIAGLIAPLIPAALGLTAAIALLGVGLALITWSLTTCGLAFDVFVKAVEVCLVSLIEILANSVSAIGDLVKSIILTLVDVLVECLPALVDGAMQLITSILTALVQYTPQIVDDIMVFAIEVLEGFAARLPELIQAVIDVLTAFMSGLIDAISGIDTSTFIDCLLAVGVLSAILIALSALAGLVPAAMVGVLGMAALVVELSAVIAAIGLLAQLPGLEWLISEGGNFLQTIGTAIGQFFGGIVGGFASGISSQFPQIGADLSAFMTNATPFLRGAMAIDPSMLDGVNALIETIILLTAADIIEGIASWFTGGSSLADFGEELVPFGQAMTDFSDAIAGMDADLVSNAATAGLALAQMATTLPSTGGVVSFFTGDNDMKTFCDQLIPFGEAMVGFSDSVQGLDANAVQNAAIAGQAMAEMATTLPNSGGVVGFFAGDNDMKTFGEQLIPFGEAMMGFSEAVTGLDVTVVEESATAGKAIVELANTLPNTGGVVSWFTGNNDMATFGEQLVPFGEAMKKYSDAVAGIDVDAVTNSTIAGQAVSELANTLPNTGGVVSWFTGDNDMATFGEQLVIFGEKFKEYSDYMQGVDADIVTTTANAATSIVELQKSLPSEGGWFSSETTLSDFGSDMSVFGYYFANFYDYIDDIKVDVLSGVIEQINELVEVAKGMAEVNADAVSGFSSALTTLGQAGLTDFINVFANSEEQITSAMTNVTTFAVNGLTIGQPTLTAKMESIMTMLETNIRNKYVDFYTIGSTFITKLNNGITAKQQSILNTMSIALNSAISTIRERFYIKFYDTGAYFVTGFINGIADNIQAAANAAAEMARAASEAANNALDIHSPSRVGYSSGNFYGLGFVGGISDNASRAFDASEDMANSAIKGMNSVISRIGEWFDSDVDLQPTITPVLDLSNVEEGAGRINSVFSANRAISLSSRMNATDDSNGGIQNGVSTGSTYSFTQNNYSPKALSRVEIYRQTRNQFSALKEELS